MTSASEIEQQHRHWLDRVGEVAGEPLDVHAVERVLELAKRVAHGADRPLAPVAAHALGVAVAGVPTPTRRPAASPTWAGRTEGCAPRVVERRGVLLR